MDNKAMSRIGRLGAWLFVPALPALAYFGLYFATVMPADTLIRIRSGSILTVRSSNPEPDFSLRYMAGPALPPGFWRVFFAPAWRVDRVLRPEVWRVRPRRL